MRTCLICELDATLVKDHDLCDGCLDDALAEVEEQEKFQRYQDAEQAALEANEEGPQ